ncbi:GNAT family N-acetyltransferase [Streptomyces sp. NPDC051940]|uniref:GNAT family N-acetyltransferase n=1 Tax=Streptomyces sp. NPDC051940 TaxID=3155675 RepID=UPI003420D3CF
METRVVDNVEKSRYEVYEGEELAGFTLYRRGEGVIAFTHTEIGEAFGGRGLAGKLARTALDTARAEGVAVLPYCPFFAGWIAKHPDYADLVPAEKRADFGL